VLEAARPAYLLYSSCNPVTLGRDLAAMPSLRPVRARVFDMFPQTSHQEVLVLASSG
jgi:23S rRNA (uracil747-C5)-methyltransferase